MARRSGLGKGLSALIPTEAQDRNRDATLKDIPISAIHPNPLQPRSYFDEESLSTLAASVKEVGILQPILVRRLGNEDYELIAGERRWRAARRAGLQVIPAILQDADDVTSLKHALVENLQRENLNALEEAAAYQQLIEDFELTHEEVAEQVGKSRATVTNTLRLLQLPAGIQGALAEGRISAGHARALLSTPDRALQESLVERIVTEGWSVRRLEEVLSSNIPEEAAVPGQVSADTLDQVAESTSGTSSRERVGSRADRLRAPGLAELEELLADLLNTRVRVEMGNKRGRVTIEFASLEDLERIYRAMAGETS